MARASPTSNEIRPWLSTAILSEDLSPLATRARSLPGRGTSELVDRDVMPYFGLDSYLAKFPIDFSPRLPKILHEDNHQQTFTDSYGLTVKVLKDGAAALHVLDYPSSPRRISSRISLGMIKTTKGVSRQPRCTESGVARSAVPYPAGRRTFRIFLFRPESDG